jgi:hypothetical protein
MLWASITGGAMLTGVLCTHLGVQEAANCVRQTSGTMMNAIAT